ncbi:MAG: SPFH domain-containing protein [Cellulosilyticaceae bacterium]
MKLKTTTKVMMGVIGLGALVVLANSFYIVEPDEVAVVQRFGKINTAVIREPKAKFVTEGLSHYPTLQNVTLITDRGLLLKVPFVDEVEKYNAKYLTYTSRKETINTSDKRKLDVQMYAQYRIENPAVYKMKVGSMTKLNQLLDDNVYPVVIQSANKLKFNEFFNDAIMVEMMEERRQELNKSLALQYGIEVIDIGIYRKNFPGSTVASIEEKMSKEIQKESERLRAEGDAVYVKAVAETDRQAKEIIAKATEESAILKADAEKQALEVYQASLTKDVEFYRFIQRMNSYKVMEGKTIFVDQDNDFLKYLDGYNQN